MLKRYAIIAFAVMIALAAMPVSAGAAANGLTSSDVQCVVEPVYAFTLPPDALLYYPHTRLTVGQFRVGELLLVNGESLGVTLTPGPMQKPDGSALPYTVSFSPPAEFDDSQSGQAFDIAFEIDADAFHSAKAGTYTASLLFDVVSYPSNRIVWQGITTITTEKAQNPEGLPGEEIPTTGILSGGVYPWVIAVCTAAICAAFILYRKRKKAKPEKDHAAEDASSAD